MENGDVALHLIRHRLDLPVQRKFGDPFEIQRIGARADRISRAGKKLTVRSIATL